MTTLLITTTISKLLIAFVYARGVTMFKPTPSILKIILSLLCDAGTIFVWQLLSIKFIGRSLITQYSIDTVIFVSGAFFIFVVYMFLDWIVFNWRVWFPKPIGFRVNLQSNSKNYVYADSIAIKVKGDGWVRK